jgi:hypothetical protein
LPEPSPTERASPKPQQLTKDNIPVFNPLNPSEWCVVEWMWEGISINDGKYIVFSEDDVIRNYYIGMSLEDATKLLPPSYIEGDSAIEGLSPITVKSIVFENLDLRLWNVGNNDEFLIMSIHVFGVENVTTRGLRVGDSAETVFALYGTPFSVSNYDSLNDKTVWHYGEKFDCRGGFQVVMAKGIVEKFWFNGFP